MKTSEQVTLLIHGTFANPAYNRDTDGTETAGGDDPPTWWRFAEAGGAPTTADRLQQALSELDAELEGTVWRPGDPRDEGLSYRDVVEWTGDNRHKARITAARELAASVGMLADRRGATPDNKLRVNFVAHSHGGNVVLESLGHLPDNVEARQVSMLGTPLIWRFVAPRIVILAMILALFLFLGGVVAGVLEPVDDPIPLWGEILVTVFVLALSVPIILWAGALASDFVQRLGESGGRPAYGPAPDAFDELVTHPAALFISEEDEADLMLHLGAAPTDVYKAMVRARPVVSGSTGLQKPLRIALRGVELLFLRPFAYAVAIPLVEIFLERFGLGFPLRHVLFANFETVTWRGSRSYERRQIETVRVNSEILTPRAMQVLLTRPALSAAHESPDVADETPAEREAQRIAALRHTLLETVAGLREQVHLRHSGYYESADVINGVARVIAMPLPRAAASKP